MTIEEAYDILSRVKESPMFVAQKKRVDEVVKKVGGIIKDLTAAHERQAKMRRRDDANGEQEETENGRSYIKSPSEYQISTEFEKHLETLSRLDSAKQWTENIARDVGVEFNRSKEYIEMCSMQAGGFVEELHQQVCIDIADVTLDGESKQWITTVVGGILDFLMFLFYGLIVFNVIPLKEKINDVVAEFISALFAVICFVVVPIVCAFINRHRIQKYDKNHAIKYSELVRASKDRGSFKKSMMLMSFGADFEEIKNRDLEIYRTTGELLKFSITSESLQKAISQKIGVLERQNRSLLDVAETTREKVTSLQEELRVAQERASQEHQQSLQNQRELKEELKAAREEAAGERQQFHSEASERAQSHQREIKTANERIADLQRELETVNELAQSHQRELKMANEHIVALKAESDRKQDELGRKQDELGRKQDETNREFRNLEAKIEALIQSGDAKTATQLADSHAKDITANQNLTLRWQIYCAALRSEYDDIIRGKSGWFSKAVSGYREKFLGAALNCGVNIPEDSIRMLESRIKNALNPDSALAKPEANRILDEFMRGIHCEDDKFQNALRVYVGDLRSGYDGILRDKLERFGNKEYLDGLLSVANEVGAKICREDFLDLQQRIVRVLRPESEPAKQQANKMLDEFISKYIKTKV